MCMITSDRVQFVHIWVRVMDMVFNITFNNISTKSWQSVLVVEETGVPLPGGNQSTGGKQEYPKKTTDLLQVTDKLYTYIVLVSTLCDKIFRSLAAGWWVSPNDPISSNNETYCRDILVTEV